MIIELMDLEILNNFVVVKPFLIFWLGIKVGNKVVMLLMDKVNIGS